MFCSICVIGQMALLEGGCIMNALDLTPVFRSAIGFDRMANLVDSLMTGSNLDSQSNWPPYNIEKSGNNHYRITMAVAGFGEEDIDVTVHDQMLIVRASKMNRPIRPIPIFIAVSLVAILSVDFSLRISLKSLVQA